MEIENRRWPYSFSQLDPMLFRVFGPKLTKKSPPGPPPGNSNFGGLPPPPSKTHPIRSYFCQLQSSFGSPHILNGPPYHFMPWLPPMEGQNGTTSPSLCFNLIFLKLFISSSFSGFATDFRISLKFVYL